MRHPPARRHLSLPVAGTPPLPSLNAVAATGLGTTYNTQRAFSNWEVQISTTGAPTFSVQLQGSLDGQTIINVGSPITATGLTNVTSNTPLTMVALNLTALSGGTLTGTIAGTESPAGAGGGGGGGAVTQSTGAGAAAPWSVELSDGAAFYTGAKTGQLPAALVGGRLSTDGSGVTQPVSGTVTANAGTGTLAVSAASLPLPTGAAQDRTTAAAPGAVELSDGTAFYTGAKTGQLPAALVGGRLDVNLGAAAATVSEQGDVAHGTTDSGNPVKQGAVAIAHGANPTPVAAAARTNLYANRAGVPFIIGGHPNPITAAANFTTAQTNQPLVAGSAGSKIVVTGFMVTASNANTANVSAVLGLAASVTPTAGQVVGAHPGIAPGSGFGRGAGAGILGVGADTDALLLTSSAPTGGSIWVVWQYYTVPS